MMDRELIERLAIKSGAVMRVSYLDDLLYSAFNEEGDLRAAMECFAVLIAEECAKAVKEAAEHTHLTNAEENLILLAIREKFSV
jgi:hypothetical protein